MRISNLKIKDFRNIQRADISFGPINILTGKNSSGKTNLLLALANSLNTATDYSQIFSKNIVTFGQGKKRTEIEATIEKIGHQVCYQGNEGNEFFCISPDKFTFSKTIDKGTASSKRHVLKFTGKQYENPPGSDISWNSFTRDINAYTTKYEFRQDATVSEEEFSPAIREKEGTRVEKIKTKKLPKEEQFQRMFSDFHRTVISWMKDINSSEYPTDFSSSAIQHYVTSAEKAEIYEEALKRVKTKNVFRFSAPDSFADSKFVFLLADIQRDEKVLRSLNRELEIYTKGIVSSVGIHVTGRNKGEIFVNSPQGPKEIHSISSGTSVMIFLLVMQNWLRLPTSIQSYESPQVMIFDELDAIIHPRLMDGFVEILKTLSKKIQLFIATHSSVFIDFFDKNQIYLLKDAASMANSDARSNRCNIYDYQTIIDRLPAEKRKLFSKKPNSVLFVDGQIDSIFPF